MTPDQPPLSATVMTQFALRRICRDPKLCPDQTTCDAICAAHADSFFPGDLAMSALQTTGAGKTSGDAALPPGTLRNLLNWILTNAPSIIALIMSLFGKLPVPPIPVPPVPAP